MKIRAAVLREINTPLMIEEVDLADPKAGEVRVKIVATGVCGADVHFATGHMVTPLPAVAGHEGAGIVDAVGAGVTRVKPGDHVLLGVRLSCGNCVRCLSGQSYWCDTVRQSQMTGTLLDGTSRLSKGAETIRHTLFTQSSFADYVVVPQTVVGKVREDAPLDKVCGLACGLGTGLGAVLNNPKMRVEPGVSIAVFGCGSVGLSAIMGAKLVGAGQIVAIDVVDSKLEVAKELGATLTLNASKGNAVERTIQAIGPVDFAFECVGSAELVSQAFSITKAPGTVVIIGAAPIGTKLSFDAFSFLQSKSIVGVSSGFLRPAVDLPRYVDWYMAGKLPLDKVVTGCYRLEEINKVFDAFKRGDGIKMVIVP